jgi:hypothetical protein
MTKQEFIKEFNRLQDYYNTKITDKEILLLYYLKVQDKSIEDFKKQVIEIMQSSKFMPRIAEFGKAKSNFEEREYSKEFLESFYDNL